jgi:hypothetical protein
MSINISLTFTLQLDSKRLYNNSNTNLLFISLIETDSCNYLFTYLVLALLYNRLLLISNITVTSYEHDELAAKPRAHRGGHELAIRATDLLRAKQSHSVNAYVYSSRLPSEPHDNYNILKNLVK